MKKMRMIILCSVFCIMLSLFSNIYAESTPLFNVGETNAISVEGSNHATNITATATSGGDNPNGKITFSPTQTAVYTIDVTGLGGFQGRDLCYIITDSSGKQVRLAGYLGNDGNVHTYSDIADNKSTSIDVILKEGETYTVQLSSYKATPDSRAGNTYFIQNGNLIANQSSYEVSLTYNKDASENRPFYQSSIAANRITNGVKSADEDQMESEDPDYTPPEGAGSNLTDSDGNDFVEGLKEYIVNPFEEVICETMLAIGDFFINLMNQIIGEEVTITALIYNQIDVVNPNFFDKTVSSSGVTASAKDIISTWYQVFSGIAIAIYLIVLLAIGIQVLLASTGDGMTKGKTLFMTWLKGVACLVFIPYLVKYAFMINELIVDMLRENDGTPNYQVSNTFNSQESTWTAEEVEFRSPEYVSNYTGSVAFGSDEATQSYISKIPTYEQNLDLMRIMRAYAGATKKFIYAVIWWILIGQLISFIVQYYKRFFMIAFLLGMFPLICIFNAITIAQGGQPKEVGSWIKEMMTNIFTQMIHAIIYSIITGICLSVVKEDIQSSATLNWLLIILAINFVSEGEKLLRKLIGAMGSTASGVGQTGQGIKGAFNKVKGNIGKVFRG